MRVDLITIFPEYLAPLRLSLLGRAAEKGVLDVVIHDLREFTDDRHRTVDDTPYGGGAGMVMRPEPWGAALDHVLASGREALGAEALGAEPLGAEQGTPEPTPHLLLPSPSGRVFDQATAHELAAEPWLVIGCGRYEGVDERVGLHAARSMRVTPLSIGDYVLNGGEVAALAIVEAVGRLLPGVIGNPRSLDEESHVDGLLEYPAYTKPERWEELDVPDVLLSGHHGRIARWRRDEQLRLTAARRPDLLGRLDRSTLDARDLEVLDDPPD